MIQCAYSSYLLNSDFYTEQIMQFLFWIIKYNMPKTQKCNGWNQEEDRILTEFVERHGIKSWTNIANQMARYYSSKGKSGKQCRQRWFNHLDPEISKSNWSQKEEKIIFDIHKSVGNQWKLIAEKLPGRTDNSIKNYFYSTIRKSLRRMCKLAGCKNSTSQMRKIKPLTLSKIFSMAEGHQLDQQTYNGLAMSNVNQQKRTIILQQLKNNCKQIASHLMKFAREKPSDSNQDTTSTQRTIYTNIIEKMNEINQLYLGQKQKMAKVRKDKKLQRNFNESLLSSEQQEQIGSYKQQQSILKKIQAAQQQNGNRRSMRYKKVWKFNPFQVHYIQNNLMKQKKQKIQIYNKSQECFPILISKEQKTIQYIPKQENYDKYQQKQQEANNSIHENSEQFNFDLEVNQVNLFSYDLQPRIQHTPLALTPTLFDSMMREPIGMQTINNQDCNNIILRLKKQIQYQNSDEIPKIKECNNQYLFPSPISAFKQCD